MPNIKFLLTLSILIFGTLACNALAPRSDTADSPQVQRTSSNGGLPASEDEVPRVSLDDAKIAAENGTAIIVDVRSAESFASGHIPGAVNIPLGLIEADPSALDLEKDEWIITYCTWQDEHTSARAAFLLLHNGYTNVTPILGGFGAWMDAGYPIEP